MKITVNGKTWQLNIGCRTFISATELFGYFGVTPVNSVKFILNGTAIGEKEFVRTSISNNATLQLEGVDLNPRGPRVIVNRPRAKRPPR